MAEPELDELVGWSEDRRGRVTGFVGARGDYRVSAFSRFLLPNLGAGFADKGDVLEIGREPLLASHIAGLANVTQRRAETADPLRSALCAVLIFALPLPSVILRGYWWLLIASGLAAAAFLYLLVAAGAGLRKGITEERSAWTLACWRILKARSVTGLPPGYEIRDEPEPEWVALLDRAYAGALEDHEAVEIGALPVPDGKLLACEPFQIHDPRPCTIAVPPGTYRVFISVAAAPETPDQRIAYAWVRLREGVPARWERARTRRGEEVSVGVDSGIAGLLSAAAAPGVIEAYTRPDCDYVEPLSGAIVEGMKEVWRDTRGWVLLETEGGARLAAFSSGFGDGVYPVYCALDGRGRRLAVAMIFFVDW